MVGSRHSVSFDVAMAILCPLPVFGIDITSAPSRRKPITVARGQLCSQELSFSRIDEVTSIEQMEAFLATIGPETPSISGLDVPFGQPRRLIENLGWPLDWTATVRRFARMSRGDFVHFLDDYRQSRAPGDKQHRRRTDIETGACSPMMLYGVPVGKMFHAIAPLLEQSPLNLIPCRPRSSQATAVEVYPAVLARHFAPGASYKSEARSRAFDAGRLAAREAILDGLSAAPAASALGFSVNLPDDAFGAAADTTGDRLDALLAGVSAAWAWTRRHLDWGLGAQPDPLEGAIVDPTSSFPGSAQPPKPSLSEIRV